MMYLADGLYARTIGASLQAVHKPFQRITDMTQQPVHPMPRAAAARRGFIVANLDDSTSGTPSLFAGAGVNV